MKMLSLVYGIDLFTDVRPAVLCAPLGNVFFSVHHAVRAQCFHTTSSIGGRVKLQPTLALSDADWFSCVAVKTNLNRFRVRSITALVRYFLLRRMNGNKVTEERRKLVAGQCWRWCTQCTHCGQRLTARASSTKIYKYSIQKKNCEHIFRIRTQPGIRGHFDSPSKFIMLRTLQRQSAAFAWSAIGTYIGSNMYNETNNTNKFTTVNMFPVPPIQSRATDDWTIHRETMRSGIYDDAKCRTHRRHVHLRHAIIHVIKSICSQKFYARSKLWVNQ